jgi:hypothetical protein
VDCDEIRKEAMRIADSMPIMVASGKRASGAKVAARLADKGYCSSKDTYFYGVKMHVVAEHRSGQVPLPERVGLTRGSKHDLTTLRRVLPQVRGGWLYGDKAYCDGRMKERLEEEQNLTVRTPVKRKKGQKRLTAADKLFSRAVSRVRQPIESLFNWTRARRPASSEPRRCAPTKDCSFTRLGGSLPPCCCSLSTPDSHRK